MPRFILVAVMIALFGPGLDRVVLTLGFTTWPTLARVVRGEILATRNLEFVLSAEALGATRTRIFWRVLMPRVLPSVLVLVGLMLGQVLLLEASLGFLGLGDPNTLTWGSLAGQAQGYLRVAWWLPLFPGLAITLTVLGFNLFAGWVGRIAATALSHRRPAVRRYLTGGRYRLSVPLFLHASGVLRTIRDPFHHGLVRLGPRLSPDEQQTHDTINREMPDEL